MTDVTPAETVNNHWRGASRQTVLESVITIMRRDLKLGSDIVIQESTPFFGGNADIDSLDVLLMLSSIEKEFGIRIASEDAGKRVFQNVGTLVDHLMAQLQSRQSPEAASARNDASLQETLNRLPHQPPFRFVSKLVRLVPGQSAEGIWVVTGEEDFLRGHFPNRPIVPGALIAEALAQVSGLASGVSGADGRLVQIDVRFESIVTPPAEIILQSHIQRVAGSLSQYEVKALCGQTTVATGSITLNWTTPSQS